MFEQLLAHLNPSFQKKFLSISTINLDAIRCLVLKDSEINKQEQQQK